MPKISDYDLVDLLRDSDETIVVRDGANFTANGAQFRDVAQPLIHAHELSQSAHGIDAIVGLRSILNALSSGGLERREILSVGTIGQTIFVLPTTPTVPHLSKLFVNHIKAIYGIHYNVNSSLLQWSDSVTLEPSDRIEFYYF